MLKKQILLYLFSLVFSWNLTAQVTNISAKHDAINEKYIISYDLAKTKNQRYFDIEIIAMIGGIKVRPSLVALSGDAGLSIKYGSKKMIVWDYFVDIEKFIGEVTFKVRARKTYTPAPPKPLVDATVGTIVGGTGLYLAAIGGNTIFKKGKRDALATPEEKPILYYYTFCDTESPNYDANLVQVGTAGEVSACDAHFEAANDAYNKGVTKTAIGLAVLASGIYTLWKQPFNQSKLKAYRKQYGLTFQPTFNWEKGRPIQQGGVGFRMQYRFGK